MSAKSSLLEMEKTLVKDLLEEARDFVKRYHDKEEFQVGDLVVWKDNMKNVKLPKYDEPILVLEVFPAKRREDNGTSYALEPRDMRCLVFKASDGEWMPYVYNSCLFTKYKG